MKARLTSHRARRIGMVLVALLTTNMVIGSLMVANDPGASTASGAMVVLWATVCFFAWRKVKRMKAPAQQVVDPSVYQQP